MLITIGELKSVIQEAIKSKTGRGVTLMRVGGLSPVKQAKGTAPSNHGVWAFIEPYYDLWMLGSTNPEGAGTKGGTRIDQFKREGWRKFEHRGELYSRLPVEGSEYMDNGWYLTTGVELARFVPKHFAKLVKDIRSAERADVLKIKGNVPTDWEPKWSIDKDPTYLYSQDEFEVFVPRPEEAPPTRPYDRSLGKKIEDSEESD